MKESYKELLGGRGLAGGREERIMGKYNQSILHKYEIVEEKKKLWRINKNVKGKVVSCISKFDN